MTEENFKNFLKDLGKKYDLLFNPMKSFLFNSNGVLLSGWYYKESDNNNYYVTLKSNAYESHIEAIAKQENISDKDLLNTTFSLINYEGANENSLYTKGDVYAQYRLIIIHPKKVKDCKVSKFDYVQNKNLKNNILLLKRL